MTADAVQEIQAPCRYSVNRADTPQYEQIVYSEVLVPDVANTFGDVYTREAIQEFVYEFARQGYGIDVEHDENDIMGGKALVVESFIARKGDQDFIEGSWVIGMKILDDDLWAQILSGDINGFSYGAICELTEIVLEDTGNRVISGITEPNPFDGHTHTFTAIVNSKGRIVAGGTGVTDNHSHTISTHTITGEASGHKHRYQVWDDSLGATT